MKITLNQIINAIRELTQGEKEYLIRILGQEPNNNKIFSLREIRENRFQNGIYCLYCSSHLVRHFGKYRGRQRFQCKSCKRTFNDLSQTPMHRTKHLDKWGKYLDYMIQGYPLHKCADLLNISIGTAFAWRHKVLHILSRINGSKLQGIIEADETYELFSEKGSRKLQRKPRKRGGVASKRGISDEQVCILVVRDRNQNTIGQVATMGRISSAELEQVLTPKLADNVIMCTDGERPFRAYCRKHQFLHKVIDSTGKKRVLEGIYHLQNVNSYHSRYKDWQRRFHGIATKYTDSYLAWFNFLDHNSKLDSRKKTNQLLLDSTKIPIKIQGSNLKAYYDLLLLDICA